MMIWWYLMYIWVLHDVIYTYTCMVVYIIYSLHMCSSLCFPLTEACLAAKTAAGKGPWTSQRIGSPWWTSATTGRSGWKVPMVDALLWWFGKPSRGVTWRHLWLLGEHHGMLLVHVFCFREKIKFESNMSEVENKNIKLAWRHDDMKHEGAISETVMISVCHASWILAGYIGDQIRGGWGATERIWMVDSRLKLHNDLNTQDNECVSWFIVSWRVLY